MSSTSKVLTLLILVKTASIPSALVPDINPTKYLSAIVNARHKDRETMFNRGLYKDSVLVEVPRFAI